MKQRLTLLAVLPLGVLGLALSCITTYNSVKLRPRDDAPAVEKRADGCHVDIFQDGEPVSRPHADLGAVELDWPLKKLQEQGPEGAIATLKAFACEKGAFIIKDLRALPMGVGEGMIYEGTLATLLGPDGRPLNPKGASVAPDAGTEAGATNASAPSDTPAPAPSGG